MAIHRALVTYKADSASHPHLLAGHDVQSVYQVTSTFVMIPESSVRDKSAYIHSVITFVIYLYVI